MSTNAQQTSDVTQRFFQIVDEIVIRQYGGSRRKLEEANNLNHGNFSQLRSGKIKLHVRDLIMTIDKYNASPDWLFTGKGALYKRLRT